MNRAVASLSYEAKSECKTAFEFHQKALLKQKWTELPGSSVTDEYASGMFSREGFLVSLSSGPLGKPGMVNVSLILHGNVDLSKLPIPDDLKPVFVGPSVAMYSSDVPVEKTTEACHKLLLAQGWLRYGEAGTVQFFKQNAVLLTANISAAPAQMGKTMVSYSCVQLSADIPVPEHYVSLHYADTTKEVLFDTKESEAAIEEFYRTTLGKSGWKATTDHPFEVDFKNRLMFRNAAHEMYTLELNEIKDMEVVRVTLKFQSSAEMAAIEKAITEAAMKKEEPAAALPVVKIALPRGVKITAETESKLEFTVESGQGKSTAEPIRKMLREAGWKETVTSGDKMLGIFDFKNEEQEINMTIVDPGFIPAELTIKGTGVTFEHAVAKKK